MDCLPDHPFVKAIKRRTRDGVHQEADLSAGEIAQLLRETEIDSDAEYDERKRQQLGAAFAYRLYPQDPRMRAYFIADVAGEVQHGA